MAGTCRNSGAEGVGVDVRGDRPLAMARGYWLRVRDKADKFMNTKATVIGPIWEAIRNDGKGTIRALLDTAISSSSTYIMAYHAFQNTGII